MSKAKAILITIPLLLLSPVLIACVILILLALLIYGVILHLAVWVTWNPKGKRILFVYSNSPVWHDYISANILPKIKKQAVILNWSERQSWSRFQSLAHLTFYYFGHHREFNPLAVVFRPFRVTKVLRFWRPFKEYKNGRPESLRLMQTQLFQLAGVPLNDTVGT